MNKKSAITIFLFAVVAAAVFTVPPKSIAATVSAKLPYAKGQSFVVTQGYDTPPTHIKKDSYALDLTQNGCEAYGKAAVAAASGKAMFLSQEGYNGGYGTELIIDHGQNIVSRYAHMIPDSITVASGAAIRQGQAVGLIGDTGLVAGAACTAHPGTHLHFAMDTVNADGTFSAYDPEPISGYTTMTAGKWYLSDNGEEDGNAASSAVLSATSTASNTASGIFPGGIASALSTPPLPPQESVVPVGGTTAASGDGGTASAEFFVLTSTTEETAAAATTTTATSTTATSPDPATTTASTTITTTTATSSDTDASSAASSTDPGTGAATSSATGVDTTPSSTAIVSDGDVFFEQLDDGANSEVSWYGDNWFDLGDGFSGLLTALTLEGKVSGPADLPGQLSLQEFKDKNYSAMVQEFPISDDALFASVTATTTFTGLSVSLKPYFYYRLTAFQGYLSYSVVLAGTASTTEGTTMWDRYIYGTGGVQYTAPFFPFIIMSGMPATSTIVEPPITTPTNVSESFDPLGMQVSVAWSTSTDPEWPLNPLHYQMNYSTSTTLSDAGWTDPGPILVALGNSYRIGIRAADNYGDVSAAATVTWNFPEGFIPYLLSPSLSYAYQYFTVPTDSTLQSIQLFTTNFQTGARYNTGIFCYLQVFDEYDLSSEGVTPADSGATGVDCGRDPVFTFSASPLLLHPDHRYQWVFTAATGNPSTGAGVQFYGTAINTAGGAFSDPSLVNAKFTVTGDSGVLFSN